MARSRRRRSRRPRRVKNMSASIPRLSLTSNTRSITLSYAYAVNVNVLRKDIFVKTVFEYAPNIGLPFQFLEGRVNSAKIYWQSDNSTSDAGSVCLVVEDYAENRGTETVAFEDVMSYPGAMTRKVWQGVSNRWFHTEPSDREYRGLSDDTGLFTITVRHSIADGKLKGRIVVMMNWTLRGRSDSRCKQALAAMSLVSQFEMIGGPREGMES